MTAAAEPVWVDAGGGYSLALVDGKLRAKNSKGKTLKSVPAKVKKTGAADELLTLRDWLKDHERQCVETIEQHLLRSLPLPLKVLAAVWADPAWRAPLVDAVVAKVDAKGLLDPEETGFLRDIDAKKGAGLVNLDGETVWVKAKQLALPHPILLEDLDDFRELASELGIEQRIPQLFRETFEKPPGAKGAEKNAARVTEFSGGKFEQLNYALGKCRTLGYRVRGGFACCAVWENGAVAEARYWIGSDYPEAETYTGDLVWVDKKERGLTSADVGPVAYSEGVLMASAIYAARKIEDEEEEA